MSRWNSAQNLRYVQANVSVTFDRLRDIRRKASLFEDKLNAHFPERFSPPTMLGIPDEVEPQLPRLIFESHSGFSKVLISQVGASFVTNFSEDWQRSSDKIRSFLQDLSDPFFRAVTEVEEVNARYCGLQSLARLVLDKEFDPRAVTETLRARIPTRGGELYNFSLHWVEVLQATFFSNLTVRTYRLWRHPSQSGELVQLPEAEAEEKGLEILGDFNDRYAFNERVDYRSSSQKLREIISRGLEEIVWAFSNLLGTEE